MNFWLVRSQKAGGPELGSDSLSIEESRSASTGGMAFQVTKLTNILPSVQDAFSGLVLSKHEEARYAFPRVSFLSSFDKSNCAPSLIMQALNVLVVFLLAVVLPVTPFEVPEFWYSCLRPFADTGLAVSRTVDVCGA